LTFSSEDERLVDRIAELAQKIVDKLVVMGKTSIGVTSFLHINGDKSELSNYLADELVVELFNIPESKLKIVERRQLDQHVNEMTFNSSGLVDSMTNQELGKTHGVEALFLASITELSNSIRINARLTDTDTETGILLGAVKVSIPKTAVVKSLLVKMILQTGNKKKINKNTSKEQSKKQLSKTNQYNSLYSVIYQHKTGGNEKYNQIKSNLVMNSGDHFKVEVTLKSGGYVYLYQVDQARAVYKLYPTRVSHLIIGNIKHTLPSTNDSYMLDSATVVSK